MEKRSNGGKEKVKKNVKGKKRGKERGKMGEGKEEVRDNYKKI